MAELPKDLDAALSEQCLCCPGMRVRFVMWKYLNSELNISILGMVSLKKRRLQGYLLLAFHYLNGPLRKLGLL